MLGEDGPSLPPDCVNGIQYTLQLKNIVRANHFSFFLIQPYLDPCGEQVSLNESEGVTRWKSIRDFRRALGAALKVFICSPHLVDQFSPKLTDTGEILTYSLCKHRKAQTKTLATDPRAPSSMSCGVETRNCESQQWS